MDSIVKDLELFIVNKWGINLVSVKDISVTKQTDGQIKNITINFIPSPDNNTSITKKTKISRAGTWKK